MLGGKSGIIEFGQIASLEQPHDNLRPLAQGLSKQAHLGCSLGLLWCCCKGGKVWPPKTPHFGPNFPLGAAPVCPSGHFDGQSEQSMSAPPAEVTGYARTAAFKIRVLGREECLHLYF